MFLYVIALWTTVAVMIKTAITPETAETLKITPLSVVFIGQTKEGRLLSQLPKHPPPLFLYSDFALISVFSKQRQTNQTLVKSFWK